MNQIFQDRGFRIHFIVYVAVNILLIIIDTAGSPEKTWFFWPLLGWGIGIIGHAFAVFRNAKTHARPNS